MDASISMVNTLGTQEANANINTMPGTLSATDHSSSQLQNYDGVASDSWEVTPPAKRRPGRPKGSGKKSSTDAVLAPPPPKVKRPVGRPRRDGLPAGSVGPRRAARPAGRPRKSANDEESDTQGPSDGSFPTEYGKTSQEPGSDWADLARSNPHAFLQALLVSLSAPNPTSSGGPSIEETFKSHLVSLAPSTTQKQGTQSMPSLYSILKTFWLPSSPPYFSLTASTLTSRVPSEHRFWYWDPQPLAYHGISCPSCSAPLINNGRIRSGPIKIYDLEKPFFIIGCEYTCKSSSCISSTSPEGRKYASTDASIFRSLPAKLKDEFPAYLTQGDADAGSGANIWNWQACGVSRSLWNMVQGCLDAGLGREGIIQVVRSIQNGASGTSRKEEDEEADDEQLQRTPSQTSSTLQPVALYPTDESSRDLRDQAHSSSHSSPKYFQSTESSNGGWKDNSDSLNGVPGPSSMGVASAGHSPQQYGITAYGAYSYAPYHYLSHTSTEPNSVIGNNSPEDKSGSKRALPTLDNTPDGNIMESSQKRPRHCCKCGSRDCKGKGGHTFCPNLCQDCGKLNCPGRNSRKPEKPCTEAWS